MKKKIKIKVRKLDKLETTNSRPTGVYGITMS